MFHERQQVLSPVRVDTTNPPEFKTASELRQHYMDLKRRMRGGPLVAVVRAKPTAPEREPELEQELTPEQAAHDAIEADDLQEQLSIDDAIMTLAPVDIEERKVRCADILRAVSQATSIGIIELRSHSRFRHLAEARMVYYLLARRYSGCSLPQIGKHCGHRDHSTVLHGLRVAAEKMPDMMPVFTQVCSILGVPVPDPTPFMGKHK